MQLRTRCNFFRQLREGMNTTAAKSSHDVYNSGLTQTITLIDSPHFAHFCVVNHSTLIKESKKHKIPCLIECPKAIHT